MKDWLIRGAIGLGILALYGMAIFAIRHTDTPDPRAYCTHADRPSPICDGERQ